MFIKDCISCETITGNFIPPAGIIYENVYWLFALKANPLLIAGEGVIILKRHCEDFNALTVDELHSMSDIMQRVSKAYELVLQPEKIHFGLYGEGVKHIHWHVTPRTSQLPPSHIRIIYLMLWYRILRALRVKSTIPKTHIENIGNKLRQRIQKTL